MEDKVKTLLEELAVAKEAGDAGAARKCRAKLRKAGYSLSKQNGGGKKLAPVKKVEDDKLAPAKKVKEEPAEDLGTVTLRINLGDDETQVLHLAPGCTLTLTLS